MGFRAEPLKKKSNYYTIKDGSFRLPSHKDDPEVRPREYTNPKTGESGVAYEKGFKALYGVITDISFRENTLKDGTTLRSLNISLGEDEQGTEQVISLPIDSRYSSDFLKKLPAINLEQEVRLMPYDFEDQGPRQVGISVCHRNPDTDQFDVKVKDYFLEVVEKNGKKEYLNLFGFPKATEEDAHDWPFYFKKVNKFLINYATKNVLPKLNKSGVVEGLKEVANEEKGEIPF